MTYMRIDKDGKLDTWAKYDIEVLNEFGWNVESMATAIRELRDDIEKLQEKIEKLNEQI